MWKATVYNKFSSNVELQISEEKARSKSVLASIKITYKENISMNSYPSQWRTPDAKDMP